MKVNHIYFDPKTSKVIYTIGDAVSEIGNKVMLVREYGVEVKEPAVAILEKEWPRFRPVLIDVTRAAQPV